MDITAIAVWLDYITKILSTIFSYILSFLGIEVTTETASDTDDEATE